VTDAFSELMVHSDPTVVIVTTVAGGERSGCLVGFHTQVSIAPVRYAIWLSTANHTHQVGHRADHFGVHWLPSDRHDLAELFGGTSGDEVDKFDRCDWTDGTGGVPLLDGCPDRFTARRVDWVDLTATDHSCVVLAPVEVDRAPGRRRWLRLDDVEDITAGHAADE
jgi:flavin reductase (DIM6/NTAB) family NADH-FMN oxidoreductase RutF